MKRLRNFFKRRKKNYKGNTEVIRSEIDFKILCIENDNLIDQSVFLKCTINNFEDITENLNSFVEALNTIHIPYAVEEKESTVTIFMNGTFKEYDYLMKFKNFTVNHLKYTSNYLLPDHVVLELDDENIIFMRLIEFMKNSFTADKFPLTSKTEDFSAFDTAEAEPLESLFNLKDIKEPVSISILEITKLKVNDENLQNIIAQTLSKIAIVVNEEILKTFFAQVPVYSIREYKIMNEKHYVISLSLFWFMNTIYLYNDDSVIQNHVKSLLDIYNYKYIEVCRFTSDTDISYLSIYDIYPIEFFNGNLKSDDEDIPEKDLDCTVYEGIDEIVD